VVARAVVVVVEAATHRASQRVKPVTALVMALVMVLVTATATAASPPHVAMAPALLMKVAAKASVKVNLDQPHLATKQSRAKALPVPHRVSLTPCAPAWT
jgi:hypothetical protein